MVMVRYRSRSCSCAGSYNERDDRVIYVFHDETKKTVTCVLYGTSVVPTPQGSYTLNITPNKV